MFACRVGAKLMSGTVDRHGAQLRCRPQDACLPAKSGRRPARSSVPGSGARRDRRSSPRAVRKSWSCTPSTAGNATLAHLLLDRQVLRTQKGDVPVF